MKLHRSATLLVPDNQLFLAARNAQLRWPQRWRRLYPLVVLLAGLTIPFVGQLVLGVPLFMLASLFVEDPLALFMSEADSMTLTAGLILSFLPIYILVWVWLRLFERRPFRTIGLEGPGALAKYGRGFLIGLVLFGSCVGIMALMGDVSVQMVNLQASVLLGVFIILIGWIVQGAAEEVLARGFMLPIIGARWHPVAGVVLSSSIFGLLHLFNPNLSWLAMVNLILFGFFAALYALWEEGLWGIFAIHTVWNWAQGNLFGLPVSGQDFGATTVLQFTEQGPDYLTGGSFGPEGGLIVTIVLLLACVAVWFVGQRSASAQPPLVMTPSEWVE